MFTKSTFLAIALGVTAICSAAAPASAYLSLTPRTEVQELAIAAASKAAEVKAPPAEEQAIDVAKATEVTAFDDTSAMDPVDTEPVLASVTTRSL
jgi:hypothetical protein